MPNTLPCYPTLVLAVPHFLSLHPFYQIHKVLSFVPLYKNTQLKPITQDKLPVHSPFDFLSPWFTFCFWTVEHRITLLAQNVPLSCTTFALSQLVSADHEIHGASGCFVVRSSLSTISRCCGLRKILELKADRVIQRLE